MAFKFGAPEFGAGAWLTFGRLRPIHTNATFYGFASMALVGLGYYVAARSSGARLYSAGLAWIGLALFNAAALAGTIAFDLGYNDGDLEYREWPSWVRLIFLAALVVTGWNLIATVARRSSKDIYLSNWYIVGGTLWTCIIAVVAILPWYQHGLGQVAVSGFTMHNAVGMWFTPLSLGVIYYTLPKLPNRPIYSYSLGVFAFWTNLLFYPIIGAHHFEFSPLPWNGTEGGEHPMAGTANAAPSSDSKPAVGAVAGGYDAAKGSSLYTANCSACHQASGEGLPGAFPPLKGNGVVNDEDAAQHIHVVLHGLQATPIGGVAYGGVMPAFAATLNDADVAAILDYERSSWGNHGKPVSPAQVAAERAKPQ